MQVDGSSELTHIRAEIEPYSATKSIGQASRNAGVRFAAGALALKKNKNTPAQETSITPDQ
jgi:hypothetical protein